MSTLLNLQAIATQRASRFNPLSNFSPEKLTRALQDFRAGQLRELAMLMDAIEETDDVLMSVVPKAKASVARHGWEILTVNTSTPEEEKLAAEQKLVLEHFYNNVRATSALDQDELGGVSLLLRQMMDAKGKRYAVHNIVWKPDSQGRYTAEFWFCPLWFFENTTGRMRYIEQAYGYFGTDMSRTDWLVTKGHGVSIACAVAWAFKHLPLRDWLVYSERHGMPGIEGVTDAQPGSPEWQRMVDAVTLAAKEFAWVRSKSDEIKTIDFSGKGELPYPALVERMDRALSALWRGADLSTISAGSGQGQGASLQGDEADLVEEDDAAWLSETLQLKVDRLVLDNVFGPDVPALAYFQIARPPEDTTERDLKIDAFAVQNGFPISRQQFSERYSRPLPDESDELLGRAQSSAPVVPGAKPQTSEPADGEDEPTAANEAGREEIFRATALADLSAAQAAALAPLHERVSQLALADTPEAYDAALTQLRADLPQLYRAIAQDETLAAAFERLLGTAMASGLASKPSSAAKK